MGYSQLILYLQCSFNNRAATVYDAFLQLFINISYPLEFTQIKEEKTF